MKGFLLGVFLVLIFPSVAYGKEDYSDISDYDFSDIQEILDEEEGITTTGVYGSSSNIINALVNELVNDEELAALVMEAVASYCELKFPPIQAEAKPVEEKPKRRRKKTDKVVS